jgi:hypothetical protein
MLSLLPVYYHLPLFFSDSKLTDMGVLVESEVCQMSSRSLPVSPANALTLCCAQVPAIVRKKTDFLISSEHPGM